MMLQEFRFSPAGDFASAMRDDEQIVSVQVGANDEAIALVVPGPDAGLSSAVDVQPGWATFPKARAERGYDASVVIHDGSVVRRIDLHDLHTTFPIVQRLPHDELLVVGSRCRRYEDGSYDLNGRVFGGDGTLLREFLLGDGINDVQVTRDGHVWVAYGDEGIFGNFGWGTSGGGEPVGAAGLVRFDAAGNREWNYEPPTGLDHIDDCYAMNVTTEETWVHYYSSFPLVRIARNDAVEGWSAPVGGAHAVAVRDKSVLFCGVHGRDRGSLCEIGTSGRIDEMQRVSLLLPDGSPLDTRASGRGPVLHTFVGARWYRLDLRQVLAT